ncbi:MAG: hypothetical protein JWL95_127 [Gemmatimonadetes bacterium]|nr:hypothetical protein [Gemmatimonadota bacterium]
MPSPTSRRGSTLVMVAFMLVALMAVGAIAADIGRFYVVSAELQTAADAAALVGAQTIQWSKGSTPKSGVDSAVMTFVATTNRANGAALSVPSDAIKLAYYIPATQTEPSRLEYVLNGRRPNAVVVGLSGAPVGVFSRFIGRTAGMATSRQATAWITYLSSTCVRPMVFPFFPLYQQVSSTMVVTPPAPELDPVDFSYYLAQPASTRRFIVLGAGSTAPLGKPNNGSWLPLKQGGGDAESAFRGAITDCTYEVSPSVDDGSVAPGGLGQYVTWATESMTNRSSGGGAVSGPICSFKNGDAGCYSTPFSPSPGVSINVVFGDGSPAGGAVDFRYVGDFILTCYFRGNPGESCADPSGGAPLTGYPEGTMVGMIGGIRSRTIWPSAVLSNTPSNVQRLVLVK